MNRMLKKGKQDTVVFLKKGSVKLDVMGGLGP